MFFKRLISGAVMLALTFVLSGMMNGIMNDFRTLKR